jgi:hypothetical protein
MPGRTSLSQLGQINATQRHRNVVLAIVFLGPNCPARDHRLKGAPCGRIPPLRCGQTLDPASTRQDLAPVRKPGCCPMALHRPRRMRQAGCWTRPELVRCGEPPGGIEPPTPSLPWNHREPLCAPPFPQVASDRSYQSYRFSFGEVMRSHAWDSWSLKQIILRPGVHKDRPLPTARWRGGWCVPADRRR